MSPCQLSIDAIKAAHPHAMRLNRSTALHGTVGDHLDDRAGEIVDDMVLKVQAMARTIKSAYGIDAAKSFEALVCLRLLAAIDQSAQMLGGDLKGLLAMAPVPPVAGHAA